MIYNMLSMFFIILTASGSSGSDPLWCFCGDKIFVTGGKTFCVNMVHGVINLKWMCSRDAHPNMFHPLTQKSCKELVFPTASAFKGTAIPCCDQELTQMQKALKTRNPSFFSKDKMTIHFSNEAMSYVPWKDVVAKVGTFIRDYDPSNCDKQAGWSDSDKNKLYNALKDLSKTGTMQLPSVGGEWGHVDASEKKSKQLWKRGIVNAFNSPRARRRLMNRLAPAEMRLSPPVNKELRQLTGNASDWSSDGTRRRLAQAIPELFDAEGEVLLSKSRV